MRMTVDHFSGRAAVLALELTLLAALFLLSWRVANSELLTAQPVFVGLAIIVDLTLTAALCHWLLGVRLAGLLAWTIIPVMVLGLAASRLLLPEELAGHGVLAVVGIAVIECSVLVLVAFRVRTIARGYRRAKRAGADGFDALEAGFVALAPSLPRLAAWARLELQLWSLFIVGWAFARRPADGPNVFTHHRQSHWFTILGVLIFLVLMEGGIVHWWLHSAGHDVAKWILFALHVYGLAWLIGDAQGARVYRSSLRREGSELVLDVRVGLRGAAVVPLTNISDIELGSWDEAGPEEALVALQGTANVKLSLAAPNPFKPTLNGPRMIRTLLLHVDHPEAFRDALVAASAEPAA